MNQHTAGGSNTTSSIGRGTTYILARLDRDGHDELAAKVRDGTMSAKDQPDNISLKEYGTSRAYIAARLDRDGHHDLAAQVRAHTMSANAAAIQA